jgi:RNA polymerase sigma-70 factor (ECF subfamily)
MRPSINMVRGSTMTTLLETLSLRRSPTRALLCVFQESRPELISTLVFLLGNLDDAHDAVQDAFIKCWRRRGQLRRIRNIRSWVFRVALNAAKDLQRNAWRRRARPLEAVAATASSAQPSAEDCLLDGERAHRLRQALFDLRLEEKQVFLLRQNASLTYDEIAVVTRRPVGTVKTQMRVALLKLRAALKEG